MSQDKPFGSSRFNTIESLLDGFASAAAEARLSDYFGCFLSADSTFLGTDKDEHWTAEEFYNFCAPYFKGESAWIYRPIEGTRKISYVDNSQNLATFSEQLESESFKATSRGTGIAVKSPENGCWFLAQYYLSFPIPNPLAKAFCLRIAEYENRLKSEADQARADALAQELIKEIEAEEKLAVNPPKKDNKKTKGKR